MAFESVNKFEVAFLDVGNAEFYQCVLMMLAKPTSMVRSRELTKIQEGNTGGED
jgi:hypothetical protein